MTAHHDLDSEKPDRVFNILLSRQVCIVAAELHDTASSEIIPTQAIVVWLLLSWLGSHQCGIGVLGGILEIRFNQWPKRNLEIAALDHILRLSMEFHDEL